MERDRETLNREREFGRTAGPCDCGELYCTGWTFGGFIGHGIGRPVGILTDPGIRLGREVEGFGYGPCHER